MLGDHKEGRKQKRPPALTAVHNDPLCPKCGEGMLLRTSRKGKNAGDEFWGCSRYPKCRGIRKSNVAGSPAPGRDSRNRTGSGD
jgi:restriction system protein